MGGDPARPFDDRLAQPMTHAGPGSRGHSAPRWIAGWAAHAVTASGAVWGLLALVAATEADWRATFAWMVVAVVVDSFDGMLARAARVKVVTPAFDGALLDTTLDYLNYVFVPAFVLYRADLLPPGWALAGAVVVCLSSAFQFCHKRRQDQRPFFSGVSVVLERPGLLFVSRRARPVAQPDARARPCGPGLRPFQVDLSITHDPVAWSDDRTHGHLGSHVRVDAGLVSEPPALAAARIARLRRVLHRREPLSQQERAIGLARFS